MNEKFFIFASIHQTLQAEEELAKTMYKFSVVPVPPYINEGCGLGIKVSEQEGNEIERLLCAKGICVIKTVKT